jgi:uncharacterized protein
MSTELQKTSRIEIIDILRGFALLGIIIVHFTEQYYAGQPPETHANMTAQNLGDQIAMGFIGTLIQGKFYMIFSFLFGLSFFIQFDKSDGSGRFALRFAWRLIILFLIGLLHHLHYRGDILTIYAVLGFVLLLLYKLPDRALLILSLLLIVNVPSVGVRLYDAYTGASSMPNADQTALLKYFDTVKSGSYLSILQANWYEFIPKFEFQVSFGRIYITTGLFLLGLLVGRRKFFERWQEQVPVIKHLLKTSLWTLLGCILFSLAFFGGAQALKIEMSQSFQFAIGGLVFDIFNACLATFYITGILLLYRKEKWQKRLMTFYAVGRMGLTTYLMQSLFGMLIFFSIGLGLLGDYGALVWVAAALVVFVIQIYFSQWWLSRFCYGFFEWLWRSATYFKWQEFRKNKSAPSLSTQGTQTF